MTDPDNQYPWPYNQHLWPWGDEAGVPVKSRRSEEVTSYEALDFLRRVAVGELPATAKEREMARAYLEEQVK